MERLMPAVYHLRDWRNLNSAKRWAIRIKIRDKWTCQQCGSKENPECHHILSQKEYPHLKRELENSVTLCEKCHLEKHETD